MKGTGIALTKNVDATKRQRRYPVRLRVRYRVTGEREWHQGTTVNLSPSGAVIKGSALPSRNQGVVVVISLPSAGGCLTGRGRIVAAAPPRARSSDGSFAIAVPHFRLEHLSDATPRLDVLLQEC